MEKTVGPVMVRFGLYRHTRKGEKYKREKGMKEQEEEEITKLLLYPHFLSSNTVLGNPTRSERKVQVSHKH
jgi:hypothetical protein